ncbi:hypothetical protein C2G38_2159791 [Gigaspora rosea]|uniref:Nudix hydrolase domain-containing protein n=1 Tax=Gigaspora rosea TaxID=44941 RepID=A0A397VZ10_9GLOM|nr:hypothetical protein C2G38_2159791 [Gigaspora rosea]
MSIFNRDTTLPNNIVIIHYQAEKALHPYILLKEEIKEKAYYCVLISDKEPLQIIAYQGTPCIKINVYKNTNNQPFIRKYYYTIALFDNLLEDKIAIKIDIWHKYIYIKGKVQPVCYNRCKLYLNNPKAKEYRRLYHQRKSTKKKIQKLEKFIQENPDHSKKTYKNDARNQEKVNVYTDSYGIETLETEEDAALRETLEELGISLNEANYRRSRVNSAITT